MSWFSSSWLGLHVCVCVCMCVCVCVCTSSSCSHGGVSLSVYHCTFSIITSQFHLLPCLFLFVFLHWSSVLSQERRMLTANLPSRLTGNLLFGVILFLAWKYILCTSSIKKQICFFFELFAFRFYCH